jgi:hypothetical protein
MMAAESPVSGVLAVRGGDNLDRAWSHEAKHQDLLTGTQSLAASDSLVLDKASPETQSHGAGAGLLCRHRQGNGARLADCAFDSHRGFHLRVAPPLPQPAGTQQRAGANGKGDAEGQRFVRRSRPDGCSGDTKAGQRRRASDPGGVRRAVPPSADAWQ